MAKQQASKGKASRVGRVVNIVAGAVGVGLGIVVQRAIAGMAAPATPDQPATGGTSGTHTGGSRSSHRTPSRDSTGTPDRGGIAPSKPIFRQHFTCNEWFGMSPNERANFVRDHVERPSGMSVESIVNQITTTCNYIRTNNPDVLGVNYEDAAKLQPQ